MLFQFKLTWSKIYNASYWENINPKNTCHINTKNNLHHLQLASSLGMCFSFMNPTKLSHIELSLCFPIL
jgi:hypothetical protein